MVENTTGKKSSMKRTTKGSQRKSNNAVNVNLVENLNFTIKDVHKLILRGLTGL